MIANDTRPEKRQDCLLATIVGVVLLLLGSLVVYKGALLKRPQGDFNCFARGGWAIRHGGEHLYRVADNNGWHYNYPPLFAILMVPFADPPQRDRQLTAVTLVGLGASPAAMAPLHCITALPVAPPLASDKGWYLPYPVSVALFYLLSVVLLGLAAHLLAGAMEAEFPTTDRREAHRRWWRWRLAPLLACAPAIGLTLVRSQVQVLLLLLIVGMIVGLLRGQRLLAGACIGGAIVLKVFPAFLLLVPIVRRDLRCLGGVGLALVLGLGVIPAMVLGPVRTVQVYHDFTEVLIKPTLGLAVDPARAAELIDATATQSQSFQVVLHKTLHLGSPQVPPRPAGWVKLLHWLLGAALTLALLRGRDALPRATGLALLGRLGLLVVLMVLLCPVCHLHYLMLAVPLVLALLVHRDAIRRGQWHVDLIVLSVLLVLGLTLPMIPGLGVLRDVGVPMLAVLLLWVVGWQSRWSVSAVGLPTKEIRQAA